MARRQTTWLIEPAGSRISWLCLAEVDGRTRIVDAGELDNQESFADSFQELTDRAAHLHLRPGDVYLLAPSERLACRTLRVGKLVGEKLRQAVQFEVSELGMEVGEALGTGDAALCWDVLGEGEEDVCWLAIRRTDVDDVLGALPPLFSDVTGMVAGIEAGLELARLAAGVPGSMALVMSRKGSLSFAIRNNTRLVATRTVNIHAEDTPENRIGIIRRELQRLLLYTEEEHPDLDIGICVVAGDGASEIAANLQIGRMEIRVAGKAEIQAAAGIPFADTVETGDSHTELLGAAWFLQSKRYLPELLPYERRIPELVPAGVVFRQQRKWFAAAVFFLILSAGIAAGGNWMWADIVDTRVQKAEPLLTDMHILKVQESGFREILRCRVEYADFFTKLTDQLPENITLQDATFDLDGRVNIKGKAKNNGDAERVQKILMETGIFDEIKPRRTTSENNSIVFEMEGTLKAGRKRK